MLMILHRLYLPVGVNCQLFVCKELLENHAIGGVATNIGTLTGRKKNDFFSQ